MKYNIGDLVWYAKMKCVEKVEVCPDCFGQKALTVIKGDGTQVSIPCACSVGFDAPRGFYTYIAWEPFVTQVTIQRIELNGQDIEYGHSESYSSKETDLFDNKEDAEKHAIKLAEQRGREELENIYRKDKHNRTWAWHVRYHRQSLKEAMRQVEYHTAKLNVAKTNSKDKELT